jgi:hypothetical protein
VALDEVHQLPNPSELLKIAADHFPETRVLATGSSTLGASGRFRDTLAGRKEEVWLTPMTLADTRDFGVADVRHRLARGGLPPFLLAAERPEREFQEWVDAYWAKDVLELFRLERRHAFQRMFELLMMQSGSMFEASALARPCEISRPTVSAYLAVLEAIHVMHVVRPFTGGGASEIVSAPRVYGFDTGFVAYYKGWDELRRDDLGVLWEHLALNELHAHIDRRAVRYWRTKQGHEIDFVVGSRGSPPVAIECKYSAGNLDPAALKSFRHGYPEGQNLCVASDVDRPFVKRYGDLAVRFVGMADLVPAVIDAGETAR